ncbi:DinB family protein, partial [Psychrobacillus sp. NPDC058041]|uniref:DinB family protein n=1 Tax=Psychrobacillus sp. NPDC058041 TaxID=3346310 RepID=UPI0036DCA425
MLDMFLYNWKVREEWFNWCQNISHEELIKKRVGGLGSILHNLFHVIDCEHIWFNQMIGTLLVKAMVEFLVEQKQADRVVM